MGYCIVNLGRKEAGKWLACLKELVIVWGLVLNVAYSRMYEQLMLSTIVVSISTWMVLFPFHKTNGMAKCSIPCKYVFTSQQHMLNSNNTNKLDYVVPRLNYCPIFAVVALWVTQSAAGNSLGSGSNCYQNTFAVPCFLLTLIYHYFWPWKTRKTGKTIRYTKKLFF